MHYVTKSLEELNVLDDFLFNAAASDPEVGTAFCRTLLSVLLQREIGDIRVVAQRTLPAPTPQMRGIRMDVEIEECGDMDLSAASSNNAGESVASCISKNITPSGVCNVYDIEPHLREDINLPKHNRFYQARIDGRYMKRGDNDFDHMPDLYILTITTYDPFGYDYMAYTIENRCKEVPELTYSDGVHQIYFYTKGKKGGCKALRSMLNYLQESISDNATDNATQVLHDCVSKVKIQPEVRTAYMKLDDLLYYARKDGREEGFEDGCEEGFKAATRENICELLENYGEMPGQLRDFLNAQSDITVLKQWLKLASRCKDIQAFMKQIGCA